VTGLAFPDYPGSIALDGTAFYYLDLSTGKVMKVPVSGGAPTTLATASNGVSSAIEGLAIDAANAYWTAYTDGTITKVPLTGGPAVILAANEVNPSSIAVDTASVYWRTSQGAVKKLPFGGTTAQTIGSGATAGLAVKDSAAYWATADGVVKGTIIGGPATLLVPDKTIWAFTLDASNIYWTSPTTGAVMKMPLLSTTPTPVASGLAFPIDVAVDATHVYWVGGKTTYTVMKAPLQGGAPVILATGPGTAQRIAVDANSVYWTTVTDGAIRKVNPK
jgi:hypothetical protein